VEALVAFSVEAQPPQLLLPVAAAVTDFVS